MNRYTENNSVKTSPNNYTTELSAVRKMEYGQFVTWLGKIRYANAKKFYDRLREDERVNNVFKQDYLQTDQVDKWFITELLENEDVDLLSEIDDDKYENILDNINDGYSNGAILELMIDSITDKYIGDT